MFVRSIFVKDEKIAKRIISIARRAEIKLDLSEVHHHYVMDFTNNLLYDEKIIVELAVMEALGHRMEKIITDHGHQSCSCGAEWEYWYNDSGIERRPLNDLARNHIHI